MIDNIYTPLQNKLVSEGYSYFKNELGIDKEFEDVNLKD
jgi:hypothetical protein